MIGDEYIVIVNVDNEVYVPPMASLWWHWKSIKLRFGSHIIRNHDGLNISITFKPHFPKTWLKKTKSCSDRLKAVNILNVPKLLMWTALLCVCVCVCVCLCLCLNRSGCHQLVSKFVHHQLSNPGKKSNLLARKYSSCRRRLWSSSFGAIYWNIIARIVELPTLKSVLSELSYMEKYTTLYPGPEGPWDFYSREYWGTPWAFWLRPSTLQKAAL